MTYLLVLTSIQSNRPIWQFRRKKRRRNGVSVTDKIKNLDRLGSDENASAVGRAFGLGKSTVRGIKKKENEIRNSTQSAGSNASSKTS